jgi:glucans biosynthesis protein
MVFLLCLLPGRMAFAFGFNDVAQKAKQLAQSAYSKSANNLPSRLENLNYDQYRQIRFNPDKSTWQDARLPFELEFFHQGRQYNSPVKINEIAGRQVREIKFDPSLFDYGNNSFMPKDLSGLGFAGFRVHHAINKPNYKDELMVFLGASYFRALGKKQIYGLSSRGLAVDTAVGSGEEFPQFVEFWIERPARNAKDLTIYALLNSRRVTGAYRFVVTPGTETVTDIKVQLYLREKIGKLGIAPLTSMYFFGENQRSVAEDYRPEVHDSDGLSVQSASNEWIWRPLVNPKRLLVTSFGQTNPAGFGLMQRDRQFASFQDLEALYHARPSAWVEPKGKWGAGRVELVQIPTPNEANDNIVAFWVPEAQPQPGEPFDIEYRVHWQGEVETRPQHAWVSQTRRGHGYLPKPDDSLAFSLDFDGPALKKLDDHAKVEAVVSVDGNAKLLQTTAHRNAITGGWRVALRMQRTDEKKPVEMRVYLQLNKEILSETWSYILPPE